MNVGIHSLLNQASNISMPGQRIGSLCPRLFL